MDLELHRYWRMTEYVVRRRAYLIEQATPEEVDGLLEPLSPAARRVTLLVMLCESLGRDGLPTLFYCDNGRFAGRFAEALADSGFLQEAALLQAAMRLFGQPYPLDKARRRECFDREAAAYGPLEAALNPLTGPFGSAADWQQRIAQRVVSQPDLKARIENAARNVPDDERVDWAVDRLRNIQATVALPDGGAQLLLLANLHGEVANGGVHQFFYNFSGDFAAETLEVLELLEQVRHAAMIRAAMQLFDDPFPVDNTTRRERYFHGRAWNDWDRRLNAFTDDYWLAGSVQPAMLELARAHAWFGA